MTGGIGELFIHVKLREDSGRMFDHEKRRRRMMDDIFSIGFPQHKSDK